MGQFVEKHSLRGQKPHSFGLLTDGLKPVPFKTDTN